MTQHFVSLLLGLFSAGCLWAMNLWPIWWVFFPVLVIWIGVSARVGVWYKKEKDGKLKSVSLIVSTILALTGLLALLEIDLLRYLIIVLGGFIMLMLFSRLDQHRTGLSYETKPWRRIMMMIWIFDLYVLFTMCFAINQFFPNSPFWLNSFFVSILAGVVSIIIWQMYFSLPVKRFSLWAVVMSFVVWEIIWVMGLLPLGYLVLGGLVAWAWYVIQLLVRFHLTKKGVEWKKQIVFLIINLILYTTVLWWFVRWI